jgi:GAF domain-containing protein
MQPAPILPGEQERLESLHALGLLDLASPEERFDRLTKAAVDFFHVPISTISLIGQDTETYKSCQGLEQRTCDRTVSFCGHAMYSKFVFIVDDTLKDDRFKDNPMVVGPPHIRFYAGVALHNRSTHSPVGVFCIKDTKPRSLSVGDIDYLLKLANETEQELNTTQEQ